MQTEQDKKLIFPTKKIANRQSCLTFVKAKA